MMQPKLVGAAVDRLALIVCHMDEVFEHFTCMEAEALADVFIANDNTTAAMFVIESHAGGDDDPEDLHYGMLES